MWCWYFNRLPTRKADVTWKKMITQITEKSRVVDKNVRERLELGNAHICDPHYKKEGIKFASKPQNKFLYFCYVYCFGQNPGA